MLIKYKNAQVGSTLTWMIATVIIIFILLVTVFVAGNLGDNKRIQFSPDRDTFASKSFFAWLSTSQGEEIIYSELGRNEKLNNFSGELAMEIFPEFYKEEYRDIWVGINDKRNPSRLDANVYFGQRPSNTVLLTTDTNRNFLVESIFLNENKSAELILGENL